MFHLYRPSSVNSASAWKSENKQADSVSVSKTSLTGDTETLINEEDPPKGCWHSFTRGVGGKGVSINHVDSEEGGGSK